jgi:hypothetical protein
MEDNHNLLAPASPELGTAQPCSSKIHNNLLCRRCDPVGDNVTWPRITLQKQIDFVTILPRLICPGQDRNRNQCVIFNVTKYTCILVMILPEAYILCLGMIVTKTSVLFVMLQIIRCFLSVTLNAQGNNRGHDRNKNQCVFGNFILGQVTLSPTGLHLLH